MPLPTTAVPPAHATESLLFISFGFGVCRPPAAQPRTSEETKITRISPAMPANANNWEKKKSIRSYSLFQETVKKKKLPTEKPIEID